MVNGARFLPLQTLTYTIDLQFVYPFTCALTCGIGIIIFLYSIKLKAFFTLTVSTCILPFALLAFVNLTAAELLAAPYTPDIHKLQMDIAECTEVRRAAGDALPVVPGNTHINKVMYPAAPNFTMWNYIIQVKLLLLRKKHFMLCAS